jgi:hypothetical protein
MLVLRGHLLHRCLQGETYSRRSELTQSGVSALCTFQTGEHSAQITVSLRERASPSTRRRFVRQRRAVRDALALELTAKILAIKSR